MADPIRIPLSPYHLAQFQELAKVDAETQAKRNLIAQTIMGTQLAPGHPAWNGHCQITNEALVITVPEPSRPQLVDMAGQEASQDAAQGTV